MHVGIAHPQRLDGLLQVAATVVDRQRFLLKQALGPLLAVVHDFASGLQPVDMVRAQRQKHDARHPLTTLNGVQHGGGVIHRAVGVDGHREPLVPEPLADAVGKT